MNNLPKICSSQCQVDVKQMSSKQWVEVKPTFCKYLFKARKQITFNKFSPWPEFHQIWTKQMNFTLKYRTNKISTNQTQMSILEELNFHPKAFNSVYNLTGANEESQYFYTKANALQYILITWITIFEYTLRVITNIPIKVRTSQNLHEHTLNVANCLLYLPTINLLLLCTNVEIESCSFPIIWWSRV